MSPRARSNRGFSLMELLVATALMSLLLLGCLQVLDGTLSDFQRKRQDLTLTRGARRGLDLLAREISRAGLDHDLGGRSARSDEAIEFMGRHGILFRANVDGTEALGGRDIEWEAGTGAARTIVTTNNEELVGFALGDGPGSVASPDGVMQLWLDLSQPRDGVVTDARDIHGEESRQVPGVLTTDDDAGRPPYTLHRLHFGPGGNVVRSPVLDGVLDLTFRYFDRSGKQLDPQGGGPEPGLTEDGRGADAMERTIRASVASVEIELTVMTRERDSRVRRVNAATPLRNPDHRTLTLTNRVDVPNVRASVLPIEVGPGQVQDLRVCTGQCGFLRVSWLPGPAHETVVTHEVRLHASGGSDSLGQAWFTTTEVATSDPASTDLGEPVRRQGITLSGIAPPGGAPSTDMTVVVVARDGAGRSSPAAMVQTPLALFDAVRPEAASNGRGSGYSREAPGWPEVPPDDPGSSLLAALDSADRPLPHRVELRFDPPKFGLPRPSRGTAGWTTNPDLSGAALPDCWWLENGLAQRRTPLAEFTTEWGRPNTYVFRVSGSDALPGSEARGPQEFVPAASNLHDFVHLDLQAARTVYVDESASTFAEALDASRPHARRFVETRRTGLSSTSSGLVPRAVPPGEVHYYRLRFVDACWEDENRDGIHDGTEDSREPLTAWSRPGNHDSGDTWQDLALMLSPFYPPLMSQGPSDRPRSGEKDSDAWPSSAGRVGLALPGRAIPATLADGRVIPVEAPSELFLFALPEGRSSTESPPRRGVELSFNSSKRTAPWDLVPPAAEASVSAGVAWYQLMRRSVTLALDASPPRFPSQAELDFSLQLPEDEVVTTVRLSRPRGLAAFTIDDRDEVVGGMASARRNTALELQVDDLPPHRTFAYSLRALQVCDETDFRDGQIPTALPPHPRQDGITLSPEDNSRGSAPFLFPCTWTDQVNAILVAPSRVEGGARHELSVHVDMSTAGDADCEGLAAARVLAHDGDRGDYLGSSVWVRVPDPESCVLALPRHLVDAALRGYSGPAVITVELSNDPRDARRDAGEPATGCRVRSGRRASAVDGLPEACSAGDCGTNDSPGILGTLGEDDAWLEREGELLVVRLQNLCGQSGGGDFSLLQLELELESSDGQGVPKFVEGALLGVADEPLALPSQLDHAGPEEGGPLSYSRLRWHERAFCDPLDGRCDPPVVLAETKELELRLRFDAPLNNRVRLTALNFRVLRPSQAGELLCSARASEDTAPPSPPGRTGSGRGLGDRAPLLQLRTP